MQPLQRAHLILLLALVALCLPFIQAQDKAGSGGPNNNSTMPQSSLSPPGSTPAILLLALGLAAAFLQQLP
ncbi:hypothetical protein Anapl_14651 [Anas platyrhynchos]|uniref:Uncharacterized protein n=1 Tax=Anas platyrhynchos TaxID=8839 RepID=R0LK64_ANAPL|nr:hypothetical protein Anapl_14651 [Anas platyrhynchos]